MTRPAESQQRLLAPAGRCSAITWIVAGLVAILLVAACGAESNRTTTAGTAGTIAVEHCNLTHGMVQPVSNDAPTPSGNVLARLRVFAPLSDLPGGLTKIVVFDTGDVVALRDGYYRARLSSDGLNAISRCANDGGFAALEGAHGPSPNPAYPPGSHPDGICFNVVADAATTEMIAPTSDGSKAVSAYDLKLPEASRCLTFPKALTDVYRLLLKLADDVEASGSPWTPDTIQVTRFAQNAPAPEPLVRPWPSIPVPAEGAAVNLHGMEAGRFLMAVQFPDNVPHWQFKAGGTRAMRLPNGTTSTVSFLVILPGDDNRLGI